MVRQAHHPKLSLLLKMKLQIKNTESLWQVERGDIPGPPPQINAEPDSVAEEVILDYSFFEQNCI